VLPFTLGDDHYAAVKPRFREWYNAASINAALSAQGTTYTAEDKTLNFASFY